MGVSAQITQVNGEPVIAGSQGTAVKAGDEITIEVSITPTELDKGSSTVSLDENSIIEKINDKEVNFKGDPQTTTTNETDGTIKRVVHYKVQPDDVIGKKKINYSIKASLNYSYTVTFTVNNNTKTMTTYATASGEENASIDIASHTIAIAGNDVIASYDGNPHTSGVMVDGITVDPNNRTADIIVNNISYHFSNIDASVTETNAGEYKVSFDPTKVKISYQDTDGTEKDATKLFNFITLHNGQITDDGTIGSLTITPASLSIDNIDSPVYNGQNQQLSAVVNGSIDGSPVLAAGQDYDLSYAATNNDYKNAGTTVTVTATGKGNYTGMVSASYTIQPRPLRVGTNSDSKIYDGKPLTAAGSIDGAVAGDHLRLITTGTQTSVGSSKNTYTIDYGDAKGNYKVVSESVGTLTVYAPAAKPSGRTCQQDGYPAGYAWDDAQQACVLRVTSVTPSIKAVPSTGAH